MNRGTTEWAFLAGETGRGWLSLPASGTSSHPEVRAEFEPSRAIYLVPAFDLVSVPQWVNSSADEIISQVVRVELENLGVKVDSAGGQLLDWKPIAREGSRTLVQSFAIPWELPLTGDGKTTWTSFIPQHAAFPPPGDAIVFWCEDSRWTAGFTRGTHWVHVENLGPADDWNRLVREALLTSLGLVARDFIAPPRLAIVWSEWNPGLHRALDESFDGEVLFEPKPPPSAELSGDWRLLPTTVHRRRSEANASRRFATLATVALVALLLVVAAAILHLSLLHQGNATLAARIEANRSEADRIAETIDRWRNLEPAIDPDRSPIELFHRLSLLVPASGFRFTTFEVQGFDNIVIRGEASTMPKALQFKGAVEQSTSLSDYEWEIPPPQNNGETIELFGQGSYRFSSSLP